MATSSTRTATLSMEKKKPARNRKYSDDEPVCQVCKEKAALYQCPRCSFRTCSLECCRQHKSIQKCSGQRDKTAHIPMSRMTDSVLKSDYFFLEDVLERMENAKRHTPASSRSCGNQKKKRPRLEIVQDQQEEESHPIAQAAAKNVTSQSMVARRLAATTTPDVPPKYRLLHNQAAQRGIRLLLQPAGMTRNQRNKSYYCKKRNLICWTVEWLLFVKGKSSPTARRMSAKPTPETTKIQDALREHTAGVASNLMVKRLPCSAKRPVYLALDVTASLREALEDLTIYDFPTIYVVDESRMGEFPQAVSEVGKDE